MMEKLRQHDVSMNQGPWTFFLLPFRTSIHEEPSHISALNAVSGAALQLPRSQLCAGCKGHQGWVLRQFGIYSMSLS